MRCDGDGACRRRRRAGAQTDPTLLPVASGAGAERGGVCGVERAGAALGVELYRPDDGGAGVEGDARRSVPQATSSGAHDYSEGGQEVSLPWGANRDRYTIKVKLEGRRPLVGGLPGGGRVVELAAAGAGAEHRPVLVVLEQPGDAAGGVRGERRTLYRINTATNTQVDGGGFPHSDSFYAARRGCPWTGTTPGSRG